jgi:hypothetical protein
VVGKPCKKKQKGTMTKTKLKLERHGYNITPLMITNTTPAIQIDHKLDKKNKSNIKI